MAIRLVLADDHPLVLAGLTHLFDSEPDFEVCAHCADGQQTIEATVRDRPDILVLDLRMPQKDGLAVLRELSVRQVGVRVVVLTAALDEDEVLEAIRLGVRGVVLKEMAPKLLLQCLRRVHAGGQWLERESVGRAMEKMLRREAGLKEVASSLTEREVEIVKLATAGLSNREIADRLHITEGTVKVHLHRIYEKTRVKSRVGLTLYAQEKGLV
jgi:DNA-binding NarL/FixJ family response regulator